jgi:hypothetical protein
MNDPIPTPILDAIGGEPLADSGFETEVPNDDFASEVAEVSHG